MPVPRCIASVKRLCLHVFGKEPSAGKRHTGRICYLGTCHMLGQEALPSAQRLPARIPGDITVWHQTFEEKFPQEKYFQVEAAIERSGGRGKGDPPRARSWIPHRRNAFRFNIIACRLSPVWPEPQCSPAPTVAITLQADSCKQDNWFLRGDNL